MKKNVCPSFAALADHRIADVGSATWHNKHRRPLHRAYHNSEAPEKKTISAVAAAPVTRGDKLAPKRSQLGAAPLVVPLVAAGDVEAVLLVAAAEVEVVLAPVTVGVVSPFELDTFPRIELAKAHTSRMLFTSEGRPGVSSTAVWFVCSKQSTHCGKTDWKVSVQEHLITSMNAPGLKRTDVTLAKTVQAWAQELMLE
jgi:hypothetical protein